MERLIAALLRGLIRLLARLPLETQRALGRAIGWLAWRLDLDPVRVTRVNLAHCYPQLSPAAREHLVRSSIEQTAQLFTEAGTLFHWPRARWEPLAVRVEGELLITTGRRPGQGVLVLVPHLGNWEFLALYLGKYGVTALYDPPRIRALEEPMRRARSRAGATLEPISRRGLKSVYRALARGEVAALLPDQVPRREAGIHAEFFGQPALTMTFAQRLIERTAPRVLVATALRVPGGFELQFVEADPAIHAHDPAVALAAMNRSIEQLVRTAPEQYQWEYRRFKRPPSGSPEWYAGAGSRAALSAARKPA